MPYIVETCGPEGWKQREVRPTRPEALAAMTELIQKEKWGTASIRVQTAWIRVVK